MNFEWDPHKAEVNLERHGVSFAEAITVFENPAEVTVPAPDHSDGEQRCLSLGTTDAGRLVVVVYMERGTTIPIISTWESAARERRPYDAGNRAR
jgi:hypothetical protein